MVRIMDIRTALYKSDLTPRVLKSIVHVKNMNWTKEKADPSTDPVIVLTNRYVAMARSGRYDLLKLGRCYHKALMAYITERAQNLVEIMLRCYNND
mgnify:FL=1